MLNPIKYSLSVTYTENKDGHLNELKSGFLNFFVVLATILDKKELLRGNFKIMFG